MAFEVNGKLEVVNETQQVSDRFRKREFVLIVKDGMYEEFIKFQLVQDRCDLLDGFQKGEEVKVSFNLKGRPFNKGNETIYFTNLDAWRIEKVGAAAPPADTSASTAQSGTAAQDDVSGITFSEADDDELPF